MNCLYLLLSLSIEQFVVLNYIYVLIYSALSFDVLQNVVIYNIFKGLAQAMK